MKKYIPLRAMCWKQSIIMAMTLFSGLLAVTQVQAQELNCTLQINADQVQTQEQQIFSDMQQALQQFMNTTKWTDTEFEEEEKIKCDILITLDKGTSITDFNARVQVKSLRPVYGTDYETPILSFFDNNWSFRYTVGQPLIFAENTYSTELTSLMAFYAYIIIGLDFDTFSEKGGDPYFERALNIVNNSQNNGGKGWSGIGGDVRDRYWLSENLNSPQFEDFRKGLYTYHRLAMDNLTDDMEGGRTKILEVLQNIKEVQETQPTSVTLNSFFDAKSQELAQIFSRGDEAIQQQAVDLLIRLDPTNSNIYRKILR